MSGRFDLIFPVFRLCLHFGWHMTPQFYFIYIYIYMQSSVSQKITLTFLKAKSEAFIAIAQYIAKVEQ
jgi:hypothetical protein